MVEVTPFPLRNNMESDEFKTVKVHPDSEYCRIRIMTKYTTDPG